MGLFSSLEHLVEHPLKTLEDVASDLNPLHLLQEGMTMFTQMEAGLGGGSLPGLSITDGGSAGSSGSGGSSSILSDVEDVALPLLAFL